MYDKTGNITPLTDTNPRRKACAQTSTSHAGITTIFRNGETIETPKKTPMSGKERHKKLYFVIVCLFVVVVFLFLLLCLYL